MPYFTFNRNYLLRSVDGVISFIKGEKIWVSPNMVKHAVAIGAQPDEDVEVIEEAPVKVQAPVGDERTTQIYTAFELIIEKNDSKEFTGQGVPRVKAVERIVGFDMEQGELIDAWHAYRAAKAEQQ